VRLITTEPAAVREGLRDLANASHEQAARAFVGEAAAPVHAGAVLEGSWGEESRHVAIEEDALTLLEARLRDHDVVLVSGLPGIAAALGVRA
jgi:UDP-N-acetylmuramyl pentapeptide synthase